MDATTPTVERLREFLSKRYGRIVSAEEAREAGEYLAGFFRLVAEWDRKKRESGEEFKNAGLRGVAGVPADAYPPAASGPGRAEP